MSDSLYIALSPVWFASSELQDAGQDNSANADDDLPGEVAEVREAGRRRGHLGDAQQRDVSTMIPLRISYVASNFTIQF